jgi:hypothetical protein
MSIGIRRDALLIAGNLMNTGMIGFLLFKKEESILSKLEAWKAQSPGNFFFLGSAPYKKKVIIEIEGEGKGRVHVRVEDYLEMGVESIDSTTTTGTGSSWNCREVI